MNGKIIEEASITLLLPLTRLAIHHSQWNSTVNHK